MACLLRSCYLSDTNWFQTNCYHRAKKEKKREKKIALLVWVGTTPLRASTETRKRGNRIKERLFWLYGWYILRGFPTLDDSNADSLRNRADVCLQTHLNFFVETKKKHETVNKRNKDKGENRTPKSRAAFHLLVKVATCEVEVKYALPRLSFSFMTDLWLSSGLGAEKKNIQALYTSAEMTR